MATSLREFVQDLLTDLPRGSATKLANHCDVTPPTITRWKTGTNTPELSTWPLIEEFFELERGTLASQGGDRSSLTDELDRIQHSINRAQADLDELKRFLPSPPQERMGATANSSAPTKSEMILAALSGNTDLSAEERLDVTDALDGLLEQQDPDFAPPDED